MKKVAMVLVALAALGLILAGCANPVGNLSDGTARGVSVSVKQSDKDAAETIIGKVNSSRSNASGDKITSNAHSADFPGIFFFWDAKQKEDGILKVEAEYFENFEEFTLTIKVSNLYYDWTVSLQPGQEQTPDGYYTFRIPRDSLEKNINMVFLNDWVKNRNTYYEGETEVVPVKGVISFDKVVKDVRGNVIPYAVWGKDAKGFSFAIYDGDDRIVDGLNPDENGKVTYEGYDIVDGKVYTIVETIADELKATYGIPENNLPVSLSKRSVITVTSGKATLLADNINTNASEIADWNLSGTEIKTLWNNTLQGSAESDLFNTMMGITTQNGTAPAWIWDRPYSNETGITGSTIIAVENITIPAGFKMPESVPFYFAADNAAVVYVNGTWVGCTTEAFGKDVGKGTSSYNFGTLSYKDFDGTMKGWAHVYAVDIRGALREGNNTIKIYAANSAYHNDGTDNVTYNTDTNPAGLIYACQFAVEKDGGYEFVNEKKEYYSFWAGVHLDCQETSTTTVADKDKLTFGHGWGFTYFRVDGLSKYDPLTLDVVSNAGKYGTAVLSVNAKGELVITIDGVTIKGSESVKVMITNNRNDLNTQPGKWDTFKASGANYKEADKHYVITIPKTTLDLTKYMVEKIG